MKVSIATPCYGGTMESCYVQGLIHSFMEGMVSNWLVINNESLVPRARNRLAWQFMQTNDDYLVFVDADIGWGVNDLRRAIGHGLDIVGGCYKKKVEGGGYVFNGPIEEKGDLMEVEETGTGFLVIKRSALEAVIPAAKVIKADAGGVYWDLFPTGPDETGRYLSEDWWFCRLARQVGLKVYVDRQIRLKHVGRKVWE